MGCPSCTLLKVITLLNRPSSLALDSTRHQLHLLIFCVQWLHIRTVINKGSKWARINRISDKEQHALKNTWTVLPKQNPRKQNGESETNRWCMSHLFHMTLPGSQCSSVMELPHSQPHTVSPSLWWHRVIDLSTYM